MGKLVFEVCLMIIVGWFIILAITAYLNAYAFDLHKNAADNGDYRNSHHVY
jgi:hypothetical protein